MHQQIQPTLADCHSLIHDSDGHLSLKWDSSELQLNAQSLFIYGFEKPWPQNSMNFNSGANDFMRQSIQFFIGFSTHRLNYTK